MPDHESFGYRLKAARALAGGVSVEELAGRVGEHGITLNMLRRYEHHERQPDAAQLAVIADALDLPVAFFTFDVATLEGNGSELAAINARLARIEANLGLPSVDDRPGDA